MIEDDMLVAMNLVFLYTVMIQNRARGLRI
jgi:hypothetical protein